MGTDRLSSSWIPPPDSASRLAAACEVGIVASSTQVGHGGAGQVTLEIGSARSIALGDARAHGVDVAVTSALDIISAAIGQKLDGILGYNFLRLYRVIIDYPCGQINFGTAQGYVSLTPWTVWLAGAKMRYTLS